ncbi:General secretion pathway protein M [Sphingobium herbicidovorans NBRC 16415]|uniref:Type II secretion system protein M n=1 Tax=Sphingobium herbicidovorans (strain ATCC 700291 / DSM 11019 / CCUG 56400 / KCTC 2939 / LMG 18315 / NBRC 16415 / MH) TaxID=1219045 RepID=A0A086P897_SPHHM|nr:type II secretion system protein M [Sphingobium herbicidovorans]KFG89615.1 General secretion pathway protein M [Sphingobium herbicidovorans NBRC 16415]
MTEALQKYWAERSPREQWMLGVMFAMLAVVIFWLGIMRPLASAQRSTHDALIEATDRNAAMRTKVSLLKTLPRTVNAGPTDSAVDQLVGQSAGEAGLTLERAQAQGTGRIEIAMASVRPVALFSWLAALETQGVRVETMSARPSPTAGSVSVQAVLVQGTGR